jgi:hypothetical protein
MAQCLLVGGGLATTACSSPHASPATSDAGSGSATCIICADATPFKDDLPLVVAVRNEIDLTCSNSDGCHGSAIKNLPLTYGNEFAPLINVPSVEMPNLMRVLPFYPEESYVYLKVACEGGIVGNCMPGSAFDPRVKRIFHDWIEAGAPTQ